jgi:hypothetical protein
MRISRCIISAILLFLVAPAFSQVDSQLKDSTSVLKNKFLPTGIRVGFDLVSFGQAVKINGIKAITQGDVRQLKFNADVEFYRYFLNFEYGTFERIWFAPQTTYINEGSFYKIGPDINFMHRDPDHSALFIGMRYARANYKDEISNDYDNIFWGDGSLNKENSSLQSNWLELTTGLKVRLYKFLWMGYTARFKFRVNDNFSTNELAPHWIPGYGLTAKKSRWGLEYWLIFRIPFRKYPPVEVKEKK